MTLTAEPNGIVLAVTGFAYALRDAGTTADRARITTCVQALALVEVMDVDAVYWATRLSLCSQPDDLPRFDALFDVWFRSHIPPTTAQVTRQELAHPISTTDSHGLSNDMADDQHLATKASDVESLRHRDIAFLTDSERIEINRLIALLTPRVSRRLTRRRERGGRERVDIRRTVRAMLCEGGEPGRLVYNRRRRGTRRLVFLLDVSGSMAAYADALLRFGHAAVRVAPTNTEVFTAGTQLSRITRPLRLRDPDLAMKAAGAVIPDWSGGTRLGESLRAFLDLWGQRGAARQAVVVIASDGWERGDASLLAEQMARLARLAHRIVWVNPHRGKAGFVPSTGGMLAAMPLIDELVAGHSFEALRKVANVIADA